MRSLRNLFFPITLAALAAVAALPVPVNAQDGLSVYISADLEGVVGVVTSEQLGPSGFEYGRFREFMTNEVNAAIEAARAAGATRILVSDSHGNGQNLLLEKLPQDILVVRSWPRALGMMHGIDDSFDAAIFIGYHAGTTNTEGVRAHTMSSATLTGVKINGREFHEAAINAAIAGHFGVPVVMVSGDDAAVEQTQAILGDVEGAVVKWNHSFHSATTMMPEAAYELIGEKVGAGLARLGELDAFRVEGPIELEVSFKHYQQAQVLAMLPIVDLIDAHTVRFVADDMLQISAFLQFIGHYESGLSP